MAETTKLDLDAPPSFLFVEMSVRPSKEIRTAFGFVLLLLLLLFCKNKDFKYKCISFTDDGRSGGRRRQINTEIDNS